MCLSPVHIKNNTAYPASYLQNGYYDVPCGRCSECRASNVQDWQTRIIYETYDVYNKNGKCVFLTFTYRNDTLPWFTDSEFKYLKNGVFYTGVSFPCFNHNDVLSFLDRLKDKVFHHFGARGLYKYFWCSEYGKYTQRPHYHCVFFLDESVDYVQFCELCRSTWNLGFMFPKYDKLRNCYVDNDLNVTTPLFRNVTASAQYVSKYVTKDLDFYALEGLKDYLDSDKGYLLKTKLPKHWQSNGLGRCLVNHPDLSDLSRLPDTLDKGIYNKSIGDKGKFLPIPRYILNKILYVNVKSSRISPTSGKPLYDRVLTDYGKQYVKHLFACRVRKYATKLATYMQTTNVVLPSCFDTDNSDTFISVALCHYLYKHLTLDAFVRFWQSPVICCCAHKLFDIDRAFVLYLDTQDVIQHKHYNPRSYVSLDTIIERQRIYDDFVGFYAHFDDFYLQMSLVDRHLSRMVFDHNADLIKHTNYLYKYRYDKTLC